MQLSRARPLDYALPALCLCALVALLYWPALSGGFIFDDYPIFAENPLVHVSGWHGEAWQALWTWSHINIQRPLAMFSYALNYALGGSTFGFKATNLGIHLLNALLVLLLARRLIIHLYGAQISEPATLYWACGITVVWAAHPLQVSAVMYVVQRMELLGFTFTLLALLTYWQARKRQMHDQYAWPWLLLCAALIVMGYGAKETVILVPGYTLLLELLVFHFEASKTAVRKTWKATYATGVISAVAVSLVYLLPHYASSINYVGRNFDAWERELTQLRALCMYLGWSLLPLPKWLHFYYDDYPVSTSLFHPASTLLCGLVLLGLLALAVAVRRWRPLLALGIGWFFVAHALTSSPIALELVFEHRNYPALFGLSLALADLVHLASQRMRSRLPIALALVFIVNLCFLTVIRAATWGSPLQLAISLAESNPGSVRAALDLARRYVAMADGNPTSPLYALGLRELQRAVPLPGASILPEEALLTQSALHPGQDPTPWWLSMQHKLATGPLIPDNYHALYHLMEQRLGSIPELDASQLAKAYAIAVARNPSRISLRMQYAELLARALNTPALAIEQWRQIVLLQKATPDDTQKLAGYLIDNHRAREAAAVLDEAETIQPSLKSDPTFKALRTKSESATTPGS